VGVRDDVSVKGDSLEGEEEEGIGKFSTCVEEKCKTNDEKAHVI